MRGKCGIFWRCFVALLCLTAASPAFAWHGPGHMATAIIAYLDLGPAKAHAIALILHDHPDYPTWAAERPAAIPEDEYLFMRASIWPDEIRAAGHPDHAFSQPTWHYVNRLFKIPGKLPDPTPEPGLHIEEAVPLNEDIVRAAPQTPEDRQKRAMALCWIFHLLGDAHQPLHATALVSGLFPDGDRGGNDFWVKTSGGTLPLHTFWDGLWDRTTAKGSAQKKKTVSEQDLDPEKVVALANRLTKAYRRSRLPELASAATFSAFVDESFAAARSKVYLNGKLVGTIGAGPSHRSAPPDAVALPAGYEKNSLKLGERRLALGGYRLADALRFLLSV